MEDVFVFEGRKPYSDISLYYDIADGLFATLRDIDLFSKIIPAKIQEYMTAGKPILCSINGEGASIIEEAGCGFVSRAGDAPVLADIIKKVYNMSLKQRKSMGEKGIEYSNKHFNREKLLAKLNIILSSK